MTTCSVGSIAYATVHASGCLFVLLFVPAAARTTVSRFEGKSLYISLVRKMVICEHSPNLWWRNVCVLRNRCKLPARFCKAYVDNVVLLEKLREQSSELTLWADSVWKTREQVWQSSNFVNYGRCVAHKFIPVGTLQHLTWICGPLSKRKVRWFQQWFSIHWNE